MLLKMALSAGRFSPAGIISKPDHVTAGYRVPAVVLVGGTRPSDQDETTA